MKRLVLTLLVTLCAAASAARAASTIYTDMPTFLATLRGTSYTENFNNRSGIDQPSFSFSSNGFAYTVHNASGDTYYNDGLIGASDAFDSVTITFTSGNIFAVGGNFFQSDLYDDFTSEPVKLTLNDGTTTTYTPGSRFDFHGFTSTVPITSLTFAAPPDNGRYPVIDNLTVGTTVPEPSTWAAVALGAGALGLALRRRRRAAFR